MAITKGVKGWTLRFTLKRNGVNVGDITGAELLNMHFLKPPDQTEVIVPLEIWGDGTESQAYFTTTSRDDIDQSGQWVAVGHIKLNGYDGATDPVLFQVVDPGITLAP